MTDFQYGLVESVFVVSMLFSPFICSKVARKYQISKVAFWSFLLVGICSILLAVIPSAHFLGMFSSNVIPYGIMLVIVFVIGIMSTISNICMGTLFQKEVPLEMMGRVVTLLNTVSMAALPLGRFIFGVFFDKLGAVITVLIASALLITTMMFFAKKLLGFESTPQVDNSISA